SAGVCLDCTSHFSTVWKSHLPSPFWRPSMHKPSTSQSGDVVSIVEHSRRFIPITGVSETGLKGSLTENSHLLMNSLAFRTRLSVRYIVDTRGRGVCYNIPVYPAGCYLGTLGHVSSYSGLTTWHRGITQYGTSSV